MNRKIKFSLNFNNHSVRTIEEFKDHFDLKEAVECFNDSRLTRWLDVHGYTDYYNKVKEIKSLIDIDISKNIVEIFDLSIDNLIIKDESKEILEQDPEFLDNYNQPIEFLIKHKQEELFIIEEVKITPIESGINLDYKNTTISSLYTSFNKLCSIQYSDFNFIKNIVSDIEYYLRRSYKSYDLLIEAFEYISNKSPIAAYEILKSPFLNSLLDSEVNLKEISKNLLNNIFLECERNPFFKSFISSEYFSFYNYDSYSKALIIHGNLVALESVNTVLLNTSKNDEKINISDFKNKIVILKGQYIEIVRNLDFNSYNTLILKVKEKNIINSEYKYQLLKDIIDKKVPGIIYSRI